MTAGSSIDPAEFLHEHLAQASPDLMRELMEGFVNTLLSAEADSVCGAGYRLRGRGIDSLPSIRTTTDKPSPRPPTTAHIPSAQTDQVRAPSTFPGLSPAWWCTRW